MTPKQREIRDQVREQIIDVMVATELDGDDAMDAARRAFPTVPIDPILDAWVEFEHRKTEEWWDKVEKTIDAEIIRKAIGGD